METRTLKWRIQGEFITECARIKCHEKGDIEGAIAILKDCMMSDELGENEILGMIIKILDGRAELRGTYPGDDYGYFELEKPDERWKFNFKEKISKIKKLEKDLEDANLKLAFIYEECNSMELRSIDDAFEECYGERLRPMKKPSQLDAMLDSYIKRQMNAKDDDYGWLNPSGKFYAVDWGHHQEWADNYVLGLCTAGTIEEENIPKDAGKYLIDKGWILLHSPAQGIPVITSSDIVRMTKSQKEYLYDYYMQRDCSKEANEIWKED